PYIALDIFCYTPAEFDEMFNQYNLTAINAVDEGIVLKGEGFIERYRNRLAFFKKMGLRKEGNVLYHPMSLKE
ncbi:MAG: hypothetical protein ACTSWN_03010, partial [Promethearchaeota archaeon]